MAAPLRYITINKEIQEGRTSNMKRAMYIITLLAVGTVAYFGGATAGNTTEATGTTETIATAQPMEIDQAISVPDGFIDITSEEFTENYIDLRTVTGYSGTSTGLMLYTEDGNGYYLEVPQER